MLNRQSAGAAAKTILVVRPGEVAPPYRLRFRRLRSDPSALVIVQAIARLRHVPMSKLLGHRRGDAHVASTRQLAMYLVHVLLGRSQDSVGRLFGRDASTVSHACRAVEDLRDAPPLESEIAAVEALLEPAEAADVA